jgi:hypothetical protein
MHRMRKLAAGLAVAVSLSAGTMALAPTAFASASRPVGTGAFASWRGAQRAAGFGLLQPTRTYGLRRSGAIIVDRCEATGRQSKRQVFAGYGSVLSRMLGIGQDNSGGPCGNFGAARRLGSYRVQGRRATLWGVCGPHLGPPCSSRRITLFLTWTKGGKYYVASSHDERRAAIVGFARSLRPV